VNSLFESGWVINAGKGSCIEDFEYYKMESHGMTEFSLDKVIIELTGSCSLNCFFCNPDSTDAFASCSCKRWNYPSVVDDYQDIIAQVLVYKIKKIMIIGGDPFWEGYDKLTNVLRCLKDNNYLGEIVILTNGACLDRGKIDFISEFENVRINILFLGCNEQEYREITGKKYIYKKVLENVKELQKKKVSVNGTLLFNNINANEISNSTLNLLGIDIGVKFIFDERYNTSDILFSNKNRMIKPDYMTQKLLRETHSCLYGQIFISSDLKIFPCPYMRNYLLGDLKKEQLYDVFRRSEYRKFWFMSKNKITGCKECKYRTLCLDCRAVEYSITKELYAEYFCKEVKGV